MAEEKVAVADEHKDPDLPIEIVLEQYKVCLTLAEAVSSRRMQTGSFFLSVLSALLVFVSLTGEKGALIQVSALVQASVCVQGLLVALVWWVTLESYRQLNSSKFKVILEMEKHLPCQPFVREWNDLMKSRYRRLSRIERFVPIILGLPFAILLGRQIVLLFSPSSS
jgi:hypothetical protein